MAALVRLTPEQREAVVLRFVADLSLDDVAAIMGRKVGAVKALQHRGLEALSHLLVPPPEPAPPGPASPAAPARAGVTIPPVS